MKTQFMYVEFGDGDMPKFFVVDSDKDYSHLNNKVINADKLTEDEIAEILGLVEGRTDFSATPVKDWDAFVRIGFFL